MHIYTYMYINRIVSGELIHLEIDLRLTFKAHLPIFRIVLNTVHLKFLVLLLSLNQLF